MPLRYRCGPGYSEKLDSDLHPLYSLYTGICTHSELEEEGMLVTEFRPERRQLLQIVFIAVTTIRFLCFNH